MSGLPAGPAELRVEGITVRYGGLLAVDDVDLVAPPGKITGLIGPNGAGKTTTFNACSGFVQPTRGSVWLDDQCLDGHTPARRAQWGLGRTFQRMALLETMTVAENVALGPEARFAGRGALGQLWARPGERAECAGKTDEAIDRCGIRHLADRPVGDLSTGQRRLVELARAIASSFRFLLLDEPSSGLDEAETDQFGRVLVDLVGSHGTGILLVEHDMALVRTICDYVYVLDFGKLLFAGPTAEVLDSAVVRAAYLGSVEVA